MCFFLENTEPLSPRDRSHPGPDAASQLLAQVIRLLVTQIHVTPTRRFIQDLSSRAGLTCFDRLALDSPALNLLANETLDDLAVVKLNPAPVIRGARFRDDRFLGLTSE